MWQYVRVQNTDSTVASERLSYFERLASAVSWADHFMRIGNRGAANVERRNAAWLANCLERDDFSTTTPPDTFTTRL